MVILMRSNGYADPLIRVAVLKFFNDSGKPHLNVLEMSLRERMYNELKQYTKLSIIDSSVIMERIHKRNLDLRTSLANRSKIQYLGGLIDADVFITGNFTMNGGSIVVSTQVYDACAGQVIRIFRYSGLVSQINLIVEKTISEAVEYIKTWQRLGGFADIESTAHKLGRSVGKAEDELAFAREQIKNTKPVFNIYIPFPKIMKWMFSYKTELIWTIIQESSYLALGTIRKSQNKKYYGWILYLLAEQYYREDDGEKAIELWNRTEIYLPSSPIPKLRIAYYYFQTENYTKAVEEYTNIIKTYPGSVKAYIGITRSFMKQNNFADAVYFARRGLDKDLDNHALLILLAEAYALSNEITKAIDILKDGLQYFPNDPDLIRLLTTYNKLLPTTENIINR